MTDEICEVPLSDQLIATLMKLRVRFYTNHHTGEIFVSRHWWNEANEQYRLGITALVAPHLLSESTQQQEASRNAEGQVASE